MTDGFEEFWTRYPRKTGKGDARKAWGRKVAGADTKAKIFATLEKMRLCEQWNRDGGRFIPYPATWLNREGWDDDPNIAVAQPQSAPSDAMKAWAEIRDANRRNERSRINDQRALAALQMIGGWWTVMEMTANQAEFIGRRFEKAYASAA